MPKYATINVKCRFPQNKHVGTIPTNAYIIPNIIGK